MWWLIVEPMVNLNIILVLEFNLEMVYLTWSWCKLNQTSEEKLYFAIRISFAAGLSKKIQEINLIIFIQLCFDSSSW